MTALPLIRARKALSAAGFGSKVPLEAIDSVTNEVWMTPDAVLRVNTHPDRRLEREARLAAVLPPELGYPAVIAHGGDVSWDWLVLERVEGLPLSRCWPALAPEQRQDAVRQLGERLRALHGVVSPALPALHDRPQLLDPSPTGIEAVQRLMAALRRVRGLPGVPSGLVGDLERIVIDLAPALDPFDAPTLVHGDLTFENVLWDADEARITAVLDFEWARAGPPDLDLDILLRCVTFPKMHVAPDYEHRTRAEDYAQVPWWLAETYPELFSGQRQLDRVRLYAIAWDVRELLRHPIQGTNGLHPDHPYHRLRRTVEGTSHLDLLDRAEGVVPAAAR